MWGFQGGGVFPTNPGPEQNLHSSISISLQSIVMQKEAQSLFLKGKEVPDTLPEISLKLPVE